MCYLKITDVNQNIQYVYKGKEEWLRCFTSNALNQVSSFEDKVFIWHEIGNGRFFIWFDFNSDFLFKLTMWNSVSY